MVELKIALLLVKNVCFGVKKGISELRCKAAPKHAAVAAVLYLPLLLDYTLGSKHPGRLREIYRYYLFC